MGMCTQMCFLFLTAGVAGAEPLTSVAIGPDRSVDLTPPRRRTMSGESVAADAEGEPGDSLAELNGHLRGQPKGIAQHVEAFVQRHELNDTEKKLMEMPGPLTCSVPRCERSNLPTCRESSCCSTKMYEGLSQITDWLDEQAIRYVVLAGTLLGAHRDQDMIPWTSDLDIGLFQDDSEKVFNQQSIPFRFGYDPSFQIPRGCEARVTESDKKIGVEYLSVVPTRSELVSGCSLSEKGSYDIDLYLLDDSARGGSIHEKCLASSGGGHREGLRTTLVTIRGKQFRAPANVDEYIECKYGKNWRISNETHAWGR